MSKDNILLLHILRTLCRKLFLSKISNVAILYEAEEQYAVQKFGFVTYVIKKYVICSVIFARHDIVPGAISIINYHSFPFYM